jgi:uncharacterized membrane protein (DUF106 family)
MDLQTYVLLVAVVALAYSCLTRYIQQKMIDKNEVEAVQKESKALNEEYKKAAARNDKKEMDRIMQKQLELLPRINRIMFMQLKPMIVILVFFAGFMYVVNHLNPLASDDIVVTLTDDGNGCDEVPRDGVFSGCYEIKDGNPGKWTYTATAFSGQNRVASNQTYFYYIREDEDKYAETGTGLSMGISTDKKIYMPGETVRLYVTAPPDATSVNAVLDNGTWFYVDLPFRLPLFNVQRIYQPYWWFILMSFIFSIVLSFILGRIKK